MDKDPLIAKLMDDIAHRRLILPTLPEVALRVRDATENPGSSAAQLAEVIAEDASLAARIIKVANSALYRRTNQIDSVRQAVARLGMHLTRMLVTNLLILQVYRVPGGPLKRLLRELHDHSIAVAARGYALAAEFSHLDREEAFLAGLVHNIGALPIVQRVAGATRPSWLPDNETALRTLVDQLHPQVGCAVLESWSFPAHLIAVVAEHQDVLRQGESTPDLIDIIIAANVEVLHEHGRWANTLQRTDIPACRKLGLVDDTAASPHRTALLRDAETLHQILMA